MTKSFNRLTGARGEEIAANYLQKRGFKIVERNYSTKFGEIDLIVAKNKILRFVEVKLKKGEMFGTPEEMIGTNKLGRVQRMGEYFLMEKPDTAKIYQMYSVDAICIVTSSDGEVERVSYYENIGF